ncbi:uncharacterized protein ACO6RY_17303 [Pungitius sinensis]
MHQNKLRAARASSSPHLPPPPPLSSSCNLLKHNFPPLPVCVISPVSQHIVLTSRWLRPGKTTLERNRDKKPGWGGGENNVQQGGASFQLSRRERKTSLLQEVFDVLLTQ